MTVSGEIFSVFSVAGEGAYFGERVSMTEHALQAAYFAAEAGASPALIVAALLHDVGHLVEEVPADIANWTHDAHHEDVGSRWLATRFGRDVSDPVRLHVPAKRDLCATDPDYAALLSPASVITLKLQGGVMTPQEVAAFETEPHFNEAVLLRRCDDQAKIKGFVTPGFDAYRPLIDVLSCPQG